MRRNWTITERLKAEQKRVFRIACDPNRYRMTKKAISEDSGIGYDSICDYANGETEMSLSTLVALIGVIPNELLSLLLPEGQNIVRVPDNIDLDEIAAWAEEFSAVKLAAHRKDSECEEQLGPNEKDRLASIVVQFPGVAA
jgi:hypothetical protein